VGGVLEGSARNVVDPDLIDENVSWAVVSLMQVETYCCTRKYVLETEPPDFVARRHHFGEEDAEASIVYDSGKCDEEGLDVELPPRLEQYPSQYM